MQDYANQHEQDALLGGSREPTQSKPKRFFLAVLLVATAGAIGYSAGHHAHHSGSIDLAEMEDSTTFFNSMDFSVDQPEIFDYQDPDAFDENAGLEQYGAMMARKEEIHTEFMANMKEAMAQQNGEYGANPYDHSGETAEGEFGDIIPNGQYGDVAVTDGGQYGAQGGPSGGTVHIEVSDKEGPQVTPPEYTASQEDELIKAGRANEIIIQNEADLERYKKEVKKITHKEVPMPKDDKNEAEDTKIVIDDAEDPESVKIDSK